MTTTTNTEVVIPKTVNKERESKPLFVVSLRTWVSKERCETSPEYETYCKDALLGNVQKMVPVTATGRKTWNKVCLDLGMNGEMVLEGETKKESSKKEDAEQKKASKAMEDLIKYAKKPGAEISDEGFMVAVAKVILETVDMNAFMKDIFESKNVDEALSVFKKYLIDMFAGAPMADVIINAVCKELYDPEIKAYIEEVIHMTSEQKSMICHIISTEVDNLAEAVKTHGLTGEILHTYLKRLEEAFNNLDIVDADYKVVDPADTESPEEDTEAEDSSDDHKASAICHFENLKAGVFQTNENGELVDTRDPWVVAKEQILLSHPKIKPFIDCLDKYNLKATFMDNGMVYVDVSGEEFFKKFIIDTIGVWGPFTSITAEGVPYPVAISNEAAMDKLVRGIALDANDIQEIKNLYGGVEPMSLGQRFNLSSLPSKKLSKENFTKLCGNLLNLNEILNFLDTNDPKAVGLHQFDFSKFSSINKFTLSDNTGIVINFNAGEYSVYVNGKKLSGF